MKRWVIFLNLVLLVGLVAASFELRRRWLESRDKESRALAVRPAPPDLSSEAPALGPPPPAKLQPVEYFDVAERFLFARDRNPNVVIETKPEPPPKVRPNFPAVYGVMDIGMGPTVFMSMDRDSQQGYRLGDTIGEFKLVAASQQEVTFEWNGESITKSLDELRAKPAELKAEPQMQRMNANVNNVPVAPPPKPPANVAPAPGPEIGGGRRGCLPGDNSPGGTVAGGYRKVSTSYAFGPICYWESAR